MANSGRKLFSLLVLLVAISLPLEAGARIEGTFSKSSITIGERVEFLLNVTIPADAEAGDMPGGVILGAFEIKDYDLGKWSESDGEQVISQRFEVSTYTTGVHFTIPWALKYREGEEEKVLSMPPIPLVVESVLKGEGEELRDLKPAANFPGPPLPHWVYYGGGALLLAIILLLLYLRRKRRKEAAEQEPSIPPDILALKALEELKRSGYFESGMEKQHYVELTEIFKHYLEGCFKVEAVEKTTTEMADVLKNLPLERPWRMKLKELLSFGDLVKFAKHKPEMERGSTDLSLVRDLVEETRGKEEEDVQLP